MPPSVRNGQKFNLIFFLFLNLKIAQQDATYSVYYISVGSSTGFGC
jgi:hypothetical protein